MGSISELLFKAQIHSDLGPTVLRETLTQPPRPVTPIWGDAVWSVECPCNISQINESPFRWPHTQMWRCGLPGWWSHCFTYLPTTWRDIINFSQQSIPLVPVLNCQSGWTEPRWEQGCWHQGLSERPYCQRSWTVSSLNWILLYVYPGIWGDCRTIHCVERGGSIAAWSTNWPWMNISQSCVQCQSWFSLTWETICQSRAMMVHVLLWFRIIKDYERAPTFASHTISMSDMPCFTLIVYVTH